MSMTLMPFMARAVAIPLPMSPPPMTATHDIFLALSPASVTPLTFFVERVEKNTCTRAYVWFERRSGVRA